MKIGRSKSGLPTITESGGGMSNTGYSTIICGEEGQRLTPLFVPRGYSNGDHAIFVVHPGKTHYLKAEHDRRGESVSLYRIDGIDEEDFILSTLVGEYQDGDSNIPMQFQTAVEVALAKAKCYHCREAHYTA